MQIVFVSNYFNHHQKPLSDAFSQLNGDYMFISTGKMREERVRLGYQNVEASYVVHFDEDKGRFLAEKAIAAADAVIFGSAPEELIQSRLKNKQPVFRYSERPFKEFSYLKFLPQRLKWKRRVPPDSETYLLCAGAYTAADYAKLGLFKNKAFRWGYFPAVKRYDNINELLGKKQPGSILWAGRLLDWKHPELAVYAAEYLRDSGADFGMELIGSGPMEEQLRQMINERNLQERVTLSGSMTPDKVRERMEASEIFLFTSDRQEGWGAVLNEAMNSGCAAAASHAAGSVPYLINDGENGVIFEALNTQQMCEKILCLLNDSDRRRQLAANAYRTITETWNAQVAAERFTRVAQCLQNGGDPSSLYMEGPCSRAELLNDNWK